MLGYGKTHLTLLFLSGVALLAAGLTYRSLSVVQTKERAWLGVIIMPAAVGIYVAAALSSSHFFPAGLRRVNVLMGLAAAFLTAFLVSQNESLSVDTQPWSIAGLTASLSLSVLYGLAIFTGRLTVGPLKMV